MDDDRLESFYRRLPARLQHLACSLQGARVQRRQYDRIFHVLLHELSERSRWSAEDFAAFRDARLRAFLRYSADRVPFYREVFRALDAAPNDIGGLSDLAQLPLTTKEQVKSHSDEFRPSTRHQLRGCRLAHTSGTTGSGFHFVTTADSIREQRAVWWRYRLWHGIHSRMWCAAFGGRLIAPITQLAPPFWRYNFPGRQVFFSSFHMSEANMPHYVAELRRRRLQWLHGYPSQLAWLAGYVLDHEDGDLGYEVKWVTTCAEVLLSSQALMIERAFGIRPRQHYGMAEAVANASECELGSMHVDEDFGVLEVVEDRYGHGVIVGTNLSNLATPLVRYVVGDIATLSDHPCACRRPGRVLRSVDGRQVDFIVCPDGFQFGPINHLFRDLVHVRESQIYQRDASHIVFRVVADSAHGRDEEALLRRQISERIPASVHWKVEYLDSIERTPSGKLQLIVSEVQGPSQRHGIDGDG